MVMTMPKRLLVMSRTQPGRAILCIVAFVTIAAGLWLFTPWYTVGIVTPVIAKAFTLPVFVAGIINTLVAVPAAIAVYRNTPASIARGSFQMFLWYSFITIVRILLGTPSNLMWVPTLIIALIMAVVYVEQSAERKAKVFE